MRTKIQTNPSSASGLSVRGRDAIPGIHAVRARVCVSHRAGRRKSMSSFLCLSGSACFCTVLVSDNAGDTYTHTPLHTTCGLFDLFDHHSFETAPVQVLDEPQSYRPGS